LLNERNINGTEIMRPLEDAQGYILKENSLFGHWSCEKGQMSLILVCKGNL
jgi:hypothetical protein